jgi:acyl-CoA reductase-like NAD-dependent aldehyde dehydrogenase
MQEEVFGPILQVLEIDSVDAVVDWVNDRPQALGLFVFSEDVSVVESILERTSSGLGSRSLDRRSETSRAFRGI